MVKKMTISQNIFQELQFLYYNRANDKKDKTKGEMK